MTHDAGFTLIEALVAMAVLAVAASGFVRATEDHIDIIARLEARAAGGWVADNALAEARVPGLDVTATTPMLDRDWQATVASHASDDPDVAAVTVTAANGGTRVSLRGFHDTAPPPPVAASPSVSGTAPRTVLTGAAPDAASAAFTAAASAPPAASTTPAAAAR